MRVHATCAGEMPVSDTFMKRKLDPHTMPASTNCTVIQRAEGSRSARVAGVVSVVEATWPPYGRPSDAEARRRVRRPKSAGLRRFGYGAGPVGIVPAPAAVSSTLRLLVDSSGCRLNGRG